MADKTGHDGECPGAGEELGLAWVGGEGGGVVGVLDGEGEQGEGVHEHPQATWVATQVRKTPVTRPPAHTGGEEGVVKLNRETQHKSLVEM